MFFLCQPAHIRVYEYIYIYINKYFGFGLTNFLVINKTIIKDKEQLNK